MIRAAGHVITRGFAMRVRRAFLAAMTSIIAVAVSAACGSPTTGDGGQSSGSRESVGQVTAAGQDVTPSAGSSAAVEVSDGGLPSPLPSQLLLPMSALPKLAGYSYVGHTSLRSTMPPAKVPFVGFISLGIAKKSNMIGSIVLFEFASGHSEAELSAAADPLIWTISPGFESRAVSIHGFKVAEVTSQNRPTPMSISFRERRNLVSIIIFTGKSDAERIAGLFLRSAGGASSK